MEQPLVSICISCYNHEKYVRRSLENAINQTYPNTEILISDDGSTDRTREIIYQVAEEYPDKEIKAFFSETNTTFGIVDEMFPNITGKYIAAFSADDYWGETAVATYVEFMEKHEEYAISFCKPEIICETQSDIPIFWGGEQEMNRYELFAKLFHWGNRICAPSMFVRTKVWQEMGGWRHQYRQLMDYEMWLRLLTKYEFHFFGQGAVPVYYRIHENNLSNMRPETRQRERMERTHILLRIMEELEEDFFVKAFGDQLIYPADTEQFCLSCEKFMVLARSLVVDSASVIIFYFDHIREEDFAEHIGRDYQFTRKDFHQLTGEIPPQIGADEKMKQVLEEQFETIEKQNQIIENLMQKVEFLLNERKTGE